MENLVSIPLKIVDSMPKDADSRLLLGKDIAFASSIEHYLAFSEICEYRIEYHQGFIISFYDNIFGQMPNHEEMIANFLFILKTFFKINAPQCRAYPSNLHVYIHLPKPSVYKPDASVFKEKIEIITYINPTDDSKHKATTNPYAVFEVLSKSTKRFDLNEKLENYQKIAGLEQIIFANQYKYELIVWEKIKEQWFETTYTNPNDVVFIADCAVLMTDLYENVDFNE